MTNFSWGWEGGLYSGEGLYMDEYLHFNNAIFVQEIVIFVIFCSNLSLLIISTLCLNLMINITPGGLFSGRGGAYTRKEFAVSKVGS